MVKNSSVVEGMRNYYVSLHPLLFQRSLEKASTESELFDILDTVPPLPVTWDESARRWKKADLNLERERQELEASQ